ncbi:heparinase II/III domain-containing protein [Aestuariimicrobium kwangyangense]|uniref:heparinase II/III domain-containing protein n=1 Tax=Aestuariimicrobium kwangyangense TaxID=396389 RepID=UPI0003B3750B|nr:heparinase II/III family protein [Aestuariimicrobium kwangyangense]
MHYQELLDRASGIPFLMEPLQPKALTIDPLSSSFWITLPSGDPVEVSLSHGVDFLQDFERQERSNRMWLWSLWAVGALAKTQLVSGHGASHATAIVRSYLRAEVDSELRTLSKRMPSADHSAAVRVTCLISYLRCIQQTPDEAVEESLVAAVVDAIGDNADWLANEAPFAINNHGVMAAMALLHAGALFDGERGRLYTEVARERITRLADECFDADGMANENTPGYLNFNIILYNEILRFITAVDISPGLVEHLQKVVESAREALAHCLWQDGSVPPIGDSPVYRPGLAPKNTSRSFSASGLTVIKDDELYVSFVCGSASEAHKHMDDTALTVRFRNHDVLIDAGSYNYDHTDPYRRCLESTRGHSGIFPKAYDWRTRREIVREHGGRHDVTDQFVESELLSQVVGTASTQDGAFRAKREVSVVWPDEIVVVDSYLHDSSTSSPGWVSRFLLGPEMQVTNTSPGRIGLADGVISATLFSDPSRPVEEYRGVAGDQPRGWRSVTNGVKTPTTGLDFATDAVAGRFATLLKLGPAHSLHDCSPTALALYLDW